MIPEQITTSSLSTDVNNDTDGSILTNYIDSKCVNSDGITNDSDTDTGTLDMNNSLLTDCAEKSPLGGQTSDNNSSSQIVPQISNDSLLYDGAIYCNIIGSNETGSAIANSSINITG